MFCRGLWFWRMLRSVLVNVPVPTVGYIFDGFKINHKNTLESVYI